MTDDWKPPGRTVRERSLTLGPVVGKFVILFIYAWVAQAFVEGVLHVVATRSHESVECVKAKGDWTWWGECR